MFHRRPSSKHRRALRDVPTRPGSVWDLCDTATDAYARTTTDTCTNFDARPNTITDGVSLNQLLKQLSVLGAQTFDVIDDRPAEFGLVKTSGPAEVGTSQVGIGEICAEGAA